MEGPIVSEYSVTSSDKIEQPIFYVCRDGQLNYTEARRQGYRMYYNFLSGTISNSTLISWRSIYGNLSYNELKEKLISYNYSDLDTNIIKRKIFIMPYGYCFTAKIDDVTKIALFHTTSPAKLIMVDPHMKNRIRIKESAGITNILDFSNTVTDGFEHKFFHLTYKVYDHGINDGVSCTDYR